MRPTPALLIAAANAFVGFEHVPVGDDGTYMVQRWGQGSHYAARAGVSTWPIGGAQTASDLARFGEACGVICGEPAIGDIFLQWSPRRGEFVRAGVVAEVRATGRYENRYIYYDVLAIEDAAGDGEARGRRVVRRISRRLSPALGDRFVRWANVNGRLPIVSTEGEVGRARRGSSSAGQCR